MVPSLLPGDYILVSKIIFGSRLLRLKKLLVEKKVEYIRTRGLCKFKKGDVLVFNFPRYSTLNDSYPNMYGSCIVKRCYGLPASCVIIRNVVTKDQQIREIENGKLCSEEDLFPHDTTLHWTLSNYGPIYVPARGQSVVLTNKNFFWYKDLLRYENSDYKIENNMPESNSIPLKSYTFQHDYFFMLGDNLYQSQDSRYWGFVPDYNIIGKAVMILISLDPDIQVLKKFRINRFFKIIRNYPNSLDTL
jgi:signal peptidase I